MGAEIVLPPADDVVGVLTSQHERVRALLAELEALVLAHAEHEEQTVFPRLEQGLPADERLRLGADVHYVAARAPTHAHAHSPESAVGQAVLGPVMAALDRLRDARELHQPPRTH